MARRIEIEKLESMVRAGEFGRVESFLKELTVKKISRKEALPLANLARRINQFSLALGILNPIVRPDSVLAAPATELEQIEYAEILRKLGAVNEALEILKKISGHDFPQVLLIRAFCFFSHWRYSEAIPVLREYVRHPSVTEYSSLVGRLNLAAALVHERETSEPKSLLSNLRQETKSSGSHLLYGNVLEVSAQLEIILQDWRAAEGFLNEAEERLAQASSVEKLWIRKWRAICESLALSQVSDRLRAVKKAAVAAEHWETVRDCSFYSALIEKDKILMDQVYFGTPYESYRRLILARTQDWYRPAEILSYPQSAESQHVIDVVTGKMRDGREVVPFGQAHHRLLVLLSRDLFKSFPVVSLFSQLFAGECFNPNSSPGRVHQTVKRLRRALKEAQAGLEVHEHRGAYRLVVGSAGGMILPRNPLPPNSKMLQLKLVQDRIAKEFTVREVSAALGSSLSSGHRLVRWAVEEKKLEVLDTGSATRYRFAS